MSHILEVEKLQDLMLLILAKFREEPRDISSKANKTQAKALYNIVRNNLGCISIDDFMEFDFEKNQVRGVGAVTLKCINRFKRFVGDNKFDLLYMLCYIPDECEEHDRMTNLEVVASSISKPFIRKMCGEFNQSLGELKEYEESKYDEEKGAYPYDNMNWYILDRSYYYIETSILFNDPEFGVKYERKFI